jgi:hypothetical protein
MDEKPLINLDIINIETPNYDPKINQNEFFVITEKCQSTNPIKKIINDTNKRKLNTSQLDFRSTILGEYQSFTMTISKKLKK